MTYNFNADQLSTYQTANAEMFFGLATKAFEGVERLVELNMQVARTAIGEASQTAKSVLSIKDPQELLTLQAGLLQPAAEKAAAYSRHLYDITSTVGAEWGRMAEASVADSQSQMLAVVDSAVKNAPAGSENVVALVKSSVAAATNAFEGMQKAARQAADTAESNMQAMSANVTKATQGVTRTKRAA